MENLIHVLRFVGVCLLKTEDSAEVLCLVLPIFAWILVLKYQIHLGIVNEGFSQMNSLLFEQPVKCEGGYDVFGSEESVDRSAQAVERVHCRLFVYNYCILED